MGPHNKLLREVQGRPIVRRVVGALQSTPLASIVVVTGHEGHRIREALEGLPVRFVANSRYAEGMGTSISAGVSAVAAEADGVLIVLGDMPWVSPEDLAPLLEAFDPGRGAGICVPVAGGRRGNPVLWAARYFAELQALEGDVGGRILLGKHPDDVCEVTVRGTGTLRDVDTPADLEDALDAGAPKQSH
jgi:molybdenum cofactor cytidylyltransferase